ncbi:MAG: TetR/AcrR family transcriptional regulator [Pseudohongiellaceae bacterium]
MGSETATHEVRQPGLRERKKQLRLQSITHAARQLFIRKGFSDTTIQDIAEAADVGLGTLYLYAKSKEDLLVLVFRENLLQMIENAFDSIPEELPFIDQVMAFFDGHIEYHKEDSVLARTVLKELSFPVSPQRRHDVDTIINHTYAKLTQLVLRAIEVGKLPSDLYVGTAVASIFGLYYHLLQGFLCEFFSEEEFRKNLRHALAMLLP